MIRIDLRKLFTTVFILVTFSLFGIPDLTIVGFLEPEGGIGKVPINIIETLGEEICVNFVPTHNDSNEITKNLPKYSSAVVKNSIHEPGKIALLTDLIWNMQEKPADKIPQQCTIKLAYSMIETSQISKMWTKILNEEFDGVIVPDKAIQKIYENSGVKIPIFVLPIPMILSPYLEKSVHGKTPSKPFIFADLSANKNPNILIKAFAMAFKNNPNVHLVLRAKKVDHETLAILVQKYKLKNVTIEEGTLSLNQFIDRLSSFDCFVNLSVGEGFSFIPREALALGIPCVITNNTASTTICETGFVYPIPSTKERESRKDYSILYGEPCGHQYDCEVRDVAKALIKMKKNYSSYIKKARLGKEWVKQYDIHNSTLQARYRTLVKPKNIILGQENVITEDSLITNSINLYIKYISLKPI